MRYWIKVIWRLFFLLHGKQEREWEDKSYGKGGELEKPKKTKKNKQTNKQQTI